MDVESDKRKLKIYIAGSFKNIDACREAGGLIRDKGYSTYVFCDEDSEAYKNSIKVRELCFTESFTPKTALYNGYIQKIYQTNLSELVYANVVVLILPCGKSAHLEAGFVKGRNGKVIIYGEMIKGEFDAMYGIADLITSDFNEVLETLDRFNIIT
jgi:hypothetical protein